MIIHDPDFGAWKIEKNSLSYALYGHLLNEEKAWQQLHKNAVINIEQVMEAAPHKAATVWPPTTHHENYPN